MIPPIKTLQAAGDHKKPTDTPKQTKTKSAKTKENSKVAIDQSSPLVPSASVDTGAARLPAVVVQKETGSQDQVTTAAVVASTRLNSAPDARPAHLLNTAALSLLADCASLLKDSAAGTRPAAAAPKNVLPAQTTVVPPVVAQATIVPPVGHSLQFNKRGLSIVLNPDLPAPIPSSTSSTRGPAMPIRSTARTSPLSNTPDSSNIFPAVPLSTRLHGLPTPSATPVKPKNNAQSFALMRDPVWLERCVEELKEEEEEDDDDDDVEVRLSKRQKTNDKGAQGLVRPNVVLPSSSTAGMPSKVPSTDRSSPRRLHGPSSSGLPSPSATPTKSTSGGQMLWPVREFIGPKRRIEELQESSSEDDDEPLMKRLKFSSTSGWIGWSRTRALGGSAPSSSLSTRMQLHTPESSPVKTSPQNV